MKNLFYSIIFLLPFSLLSQWTGSWYSSYVVMGTAQRMNMKIEEKNSVYTVRIANPDTKKITHHEMENVLIKEDSISWEWALYHLKFNGKYFQQGDSIYGLMQQGDIHWKVSFLKTEKDLIVVRKPQEPIPPFPYQREDVTIKNGEVVLAGTLTTPINGKADFPIVILASGSGPQDRDCNILGHKSFLIIADYFARNGIGCLRFDDRGTGKSTGNYSMASLIDFSTDVNSCVKFISEQEKFKGHPIGIIGHSEGGMHALIAASKNKDVNFIVELASVGVTGREILVNQQYIIPLKSGYSDEYASWNRDLYDGMCSIISKYNQEKAVEPLSKYFEEMYEKAPKEYKDKTPFVSFTMGMQMFINNTWGREFISYDAKDYLKKTKIPILAIQGGEDIQVDPILNQSAFNASFIKSKRKNSKAIIIEHLNHLLQTCTTCNVMEYGELDESFSPSVLKTMSEWILSL